jgi:hypothetical protein
MLYYCVQTHASQFATRIFAVVDTNTESRKRAMSFLRVELWQFLSKVLKFKHKCGNISTKVGEKHYDKNSVDGCSKTAGIV